MKEQQLTLSTLGKTWIFDLDGTLLIHNGYKEGVDEFLPHALTLLNSIPEEDYILILTGREQEAQAQTEEFLKEHGVRYDNILFGMPLGERILFNDAKPSGLCCAYGVDCVRNEGLGGFSYVIDENL